MVIRYSPFGPRADAARIDLYLQSAVFPETFRHRQLQDTTPQDAKSMSPLAKPGKYTKSEQS